ncbi:ABC transporter ATP-binding protein [Rhizobium sp. Leaf384]|uniref:ABC transporter ATP-binding protein n=1 Tax=unclassified Rhizobium TaxID=2613769 RepID=UPI0007145173|nr:MULTISPECIES: ABC transporter ATP-binding protein [unclassified Rhizobium]KQS77438.1 ABC transporter ATP-binding protein [Rhizobium sp. Leaf383]KQS80654.1 ABC transporter ATP-binding protein [Rhizobium sp. Leaf384]
MSSSPPALVRSLLIDFWRASRLTLFLVAALVVAASISTVAAPYLFSRSINRLAGGGVPEALVYGLLAYALLLGISTALSTAQIYLAQVCTESLGLIASTVFFGRLLHKTAPFFVEHNSVEIESAGQRGQDALLILVHLALALLIPGVVQIVLTLALLGATVSLDIVGVVTAYGIVYVLLAVISNRRTRVYFERAIAAGQDNARFIGNAMNGMETLRHFGAHGWLRTIFRNKARDVFENWRAYCLVRIGITSLQAGALTIQMAVTFLILMPRMRAGAISVGDIVLFNALLLQLNQPFEAIGHMINEIAISRGNLAPMRTLWMAPEESVTLSGEPLHLPTGTVRFDAVSYRYDNGRGVHNISFTATRGGITALTGETGAGKSTVFRLALKSLEPQRGTITVDGRPLSSLDRADWYARIAVVPQDIMLLNDTLAVNIALGRSLDPERLRRAVSQAAILDTIDALPDGFETPVGERGLKLSGGERQRIAIARALYGDPDILFLDEASSALDAATEQDILQHLREISDRVTVIAITHRTAMILPGDTVVRIVAPVSADVA